MATNKDTQSISAFLELVRAGLWDTEVQLAQYREVNLNNIFDMASEQSVVGLVAAGLEHVADIKVSKEELLQFIGQAIHIEQRNIAMNAFVATLIERLRNADIYSILLKGQGIAQCFDKPLWRACGDVDLLLDEVNYEKAKLFLLPLASECDVEEKYGKHIGLTIDGWSIELHGTQHCELSWRTDRVIDKTQEAVLVGGNVRTWMNGNTIVYLPAPNEDVFFVFTHFIKHFFKEGVGLRQICDWCRLLYVYRESIDNKLLETRLKKSRLMTEWKVFAAFAVDKLGMPEYAMPFYSSKARWGRKAEQVMAFVMEVGNFGHNKDMSYFRKYPYLIRKAISFYRRSGSLIHHAGIFPFDSIRFVPGFIFNGLRSAANGE